MGFIKKLYDFLVIPFVNLLTVNSKGRILVFPEVVFSVTSWLLTNAILKLIGYDLESINSFYLFLFLQTMAYLLFIDISPDDSKGIDEIKLELNYSKFKFYRNTIILIIVNASSAFVYFN